MGKSKKKNTKMKQRKKAKRRLNRDFEAKLAAANNISKEEREYNQKMRRLRAGLKLQL